MCSLVCSQDRLGIVHPVRLVLHVLRRGHRNGLLSILWLVRLDLKRLLALLLPLSDSVATCRHKLRCMVNTANLRPQIVLLLAEVERISHDFSLQVSCEADFDLACGFQVLRLEVRQGRPGPFCLIRYKVSVLVDAGATSLTAIGPLILRQILCLKDLTDVIVFDSTGDFAPEAERTGLCLSCQRLERFLQDQ